MTARERQEVDVVDSVTVEFTSYQFFHIPNKSNIRNKAYAELKKAAAREYGKYGNIDVRNIVISGGGSDWDALNIVGALAISGVGIMIGALGADFPSNVAKWSYESVFNRFWGHGRHSENNRYRRCGLYKAASGSRCLEQSVQAKLQGSAATISAELIKTIPQNTTIAVLSIGSNSMVISETTVGSLNSILSARGGSPLWTGRGLTRYGGAKFPTVRRGQR
ncbi:MAG: hypothetical protein LBD58_05535 [Treponema sp.]|nr:hypothetical protein [Treponema sp.]